MRKNISYIEDSFSAECKDAQVRIKPFLLTRKRVSREVRKALREQAKEWLVNYIRNKEYKEIFSEILENKIQKPLSLKLKKTYPLALCEIRIFKIEGLKEQEKLKIETEKIKPKEKKIKKKEEKIEKTIEETEKELKEEKRGEEAEEEEREKEKKVEEE